MATLSRSVLLGLTALVAAGCGGGETFVPVTGTVRVDGKPAAGAIIMFYLDGPADLKFQPPTATAKEDGTFTLATGASGGVKPGKYIATVVWPDPSKKPTDAQRMMGANASDAPDLLAGRYAKRETSTLKVEIKSTATVLDPFDLK